jgi:hypothetical protein
MILITHLYTIQNLEKSKVLYLSDGPSRLSTVEEGEKLIYQDIILNLKTAIAQWI